MAKDTSESGMSAESVAFLAEAKKGKLRRFVMISKGSQIVSMVVYKKGSLEKFKKEAKESGKGHFCFGVVEGSGSNMTFKLASSDGFTAPPTKNAVLKSYLADSEFSCKPEYVIVPTLPDVPDDDDLQAADQDQAQQVKAETPASADQSEPSSGDNQEKLKRQLLDILAKIVPLIKQQIAQSPERKDELLTPIAEIKSLIAAGSLDEAKLLVQAIAKQVMAGATAPSQPAPTTSSTSQNSAGLDQWQKLRLEVVQNLKELAKFVASTKSPDAAKAIIELKLVIGNLSESPSPSQVTDLIRYLQEDDVVKAVCDLAFDFRSPSLMVLEKMN